MLYARGPACGPADTGDRDAAAWQVAVAARWSSLSPVPVYMAAAPGPDTEHSSWAGLLRELAACAPGVTYVDLTSGTDDLHAAAAADTDTEQVWAAAGTQLMRRMTVSERPVTKAVVVDADNTLWGGICGEVGPENVDTAGPYQAIQDFLSRQRAAGRALCLCSRNNRADVEAVSGCTRTCRFGWKTSPIRTGWEPKSRSIAALASQLAFAPGSLVYIDDSPAERAEVALAHPDLTVVNLADDPREFIRCLRATWQLDIHEQTAEDGLRARFSAMEGHRRALAETARHSRNTWTAGPQDHRHGQRRIGRRADQPACAEDQPVQPAAEAAHRRHDPAAAGRGHGHAVDPGM